MRKIYVVWLAICAMLIGACEQGGVNDGRTLFELESTSLIRVNAEASESEVLYSITNPLEGATVTATADVEWISDFSYEADRVSFAIAANETGSERSGKVTLSYDVYTITVGVLQSSLGGDVSGPYVSLTTRNNMEFTAVGGDGEIGYVLYNVEEGTVPNVVSNVDWITNIEVEAEVVKFQVSTNRTTEVRNGNIALAIGSSQAIVKVTQAAASNDVIMSVESNYVRVGEEVHITVEYAGEDVTASTKIYDYYTAEEISNPVVFDETGERIFYGMYNGKRSKVLTIYVVPANTPEFPTDSNVNSYDFNYRMLLVDHTGSNCGYCPAMKTTLRDMYENPQYGSGVNIVYSYSFSSQELCYSSDATAVRNYYREVCKNSSMPLSGYPSVTCNYLHAHAASVATVMTQIDMLWRDVADAGVAVASHMDGNNLILSTEIKSSVSQYYRVAVWVLEDGIYERQASGQEWMNTHHDVLRDCLTEVTNKEIAGLEWGYVRANDTSRKVLEFTIEDNPNWQSENFKLAIVISAPNNDKGGKYEVVNTLICNIGESVGFEYN